MHIVWVEWSGTYWEVSGDIADYGGWINQLS